MVVVVVVLLATAKSAAINRARKVSDKCSGSVSGGRTEQHRELNYFFFFSFVLLALVSLCFVPLVVLFFFSPKSFQVESTLASRIFFGVLSAGKKINQKKKKMSLSVLVVSRAEFEDIERAMEAADELIKRRKVDPDALALPPSPSLSLIPATTAPTTVPTWPEGPLPDVIDFGLSILFVSKPTCFNSF
jgi:hypothetical protein